VRRRHHSRVPAQLLARIWSELPRSLCGQRSRKSANGLVRSPPEQSRWQNTIVGGWPDSVSWRCCWAVQDTITTYESVPASEVVSPTGVRAGSSGSGSLMPNGRTNPSPERNARRPSPGVPRSDLLDSQFTGMARSLGRVAGRAFPVLFCRLPHENCMVHTVGAGRCSPLGRRLAGSGQQEGSHSQGDEGTCSYTLVALDLWLIALARDGRLIAPTR
jgi:hypothetical protein